MTGSPSKITITSLTDGPYEVVGEADILAADGTLVKETSKSYLCRCGHSAKKPFCDGAHQKEGFTAPRGPRYYAALTRGTTGTRPAPRSR